MSAKTAKFMATQTNESAPIGPAFGAAKLSKIDAEIHASMNSAAV